MRRNPDTNNASDDIFQTGARQGGGIVFAAKEEHDLIVATMVISVDRTGNSAKRSLNWAMYIRMLMGW